MAMIRLLNGGTFFGNVIDYDWKGKFLVVVINEITVEGKPDKRIISWNNVESVFDEEYDKKVSK